MALKFLNKKGWHTGSLRNIETVWKAEQKHEGEQKKLEELRKQIQDEREKSEFRLMQEQAGLVPKQERLEFLYDSGLQVGKVAQADEYLLGKPVEEAVQPESDVGQVAAKPGALFVEEKPASANDSWRKLHSDPLFMIRQQEQAAIAKIKSNPVKMAEIKKAAEMKKKLKEEKKKKRKEAKRERREKKKRKKLRSSSSEDSSDSDNPQKDRKHGDESVADGDAGHKGKGTQVLSPRSPSRSPTRSPVRRDRRQSPRKSRGDDLASRDASKGHGSQQGHKTSDLRSTFNDEGREREQKGRDQRLKGPEDRGYEKRKRAPSRSLSRSLSRSPIRRRDYDQSRSRRDELDSRGVSKSAGRHREHNFGDRRFQESVRQDSRPRDTREEERSRTSSNNVSAGDLRNNDPVVREKKLDAEDEVARRKDTNGTTVGVPSRPMNRGRPPKPGQLSDAERAARLTEMQANADVHEEQRWQRLKRAADADAKEVKRSDKDKSNEEFLADTQKSIFGSERASASTIEKSVKRRAHFIERSNADNERNAFRR